MAMSRSENMRRIRSRNTSPELAVRRMLRSLGFKGYRLHREDIPGKPDIAFIGKRKAIFVHGCFWHGHTCKVGHRKPVSNQSYWLPKIERTRMRDIRNVNELVKLNWTILVIWECELRDAVVLSSRIDAFLAT